MTFPTFPDIQEETDKTDTETQKMKWKTAEPDDDKKGGDRDRKQTE